MHWLLVPAAYGLGSVSFSLLLVRRIAQRDVREMGSGNAGATNVLRTVGGTPALVVLVLDILKGIVPIVLGRRLGAPAAVLGCAAVAVVCGHMYPLFHQFRGGKGVATAAGALGALQWQLLVPCGLSFLVLVALTRYVSLASIVAVALFPLLAWGTGPATPGGWWPALASSGIAGLTIWRHRANIERLLARDEARLGERGGG